MLRTKRIFDPHDLESWLSFDDRGNPWRNLGKAPGLVAWYSAQRSSITRGAQLAAQCTAANLEYLSHVSNASLQMGDNYLWIAAWVKPDSVTGQAGIVCKFTGGSREYALDRNNADARFFIGNGAGGTLGNVVILNALSVGTWTFLLAYHDPVNNLVGLSIDGGAFSTGATSGPGVSTSDAFTIGLDASNSAYFGGAIACVGLWKPSAIPSAAQVTALYNAGVPLAHNQLSSTVTTGLVSYWDLNEESGIRYDQVTANANDLTDNNTVTSTGGTCLNAVTQINDLSGNAYHQSQATQGKKPVVRLGINGYLSLSSDANDFLLNAGAGAPFAGSDIAFTLYIVAKPFSASATYGYTAINAAGVANQHALIQISSQYRSSRTDDAAANSAFTGGTVTATPQILTLVFTGTTVSLYKNGEAVFVDQAQDVGVATFTDISICGHVRAGNLINPFIGDTGEVAYCTGAHSNGTRRKLERALSQEWGIALAA